MTRSTSMITAAFKRYLNRDYRHNPLVGNFQYSKKKNTLSPTYLYSSPFVGTVVHSKTYDYFKERSDREQTEKQKVQQIFVELSASRDGWTTVTLTKS
jgi:hypothetical protein